MSLQRFLIFAGLLILVIFLVARWEIRDTRPELEEEPLAEAEANAEEFVKEESSSVSVEIREIVTPSSSALVEIESGRFKVVTRIANDSEAAEIYGEFMERGGIIVAKDASSELWLFGRCGSGDRWVPLLDSGLDLNAFAFDRPRKIDSRDFRSIDQALVGDRREIFLVMPKQFEAVVLTKIEQCLPGPLADFGSAQIMVSATSAGRLNFRVESAVKLSNESGTLRLMIQKEFQGI